MSEQATVQTVSDDEPSEDVEDMHVDEQSSKKRKITGAAAHKCLKRVEGNHVRLTMEQKAKLSVFAADHSHLSREAVINWAVKEFDLKEAPPPSLITSLKRDAKVEWAKNYLLQETVSKKQSKSATHGHILPDIMDARELLALDPEPPHDEPEPEPVVEGVEENEETEKKVTYKPVTLKEARACMAKVAEFIQVNSSTRGLGRLVDVSIEIQSELDKTVVTTGHRQALMTAYVRPPPKITTISSP
jgi:hypothetical protein